MHLVFDSEIARVYGVNEAIMIANFQFWILKNKANETNCFDGHYWTYNSNKAFQELFPFWSAKTIRTTLDHLKDQNIIITGNYNKQTYDRTLWYAFADEDKWLGSNGQMDLPKTANGFVQNGKPIPDILPDNNNISVAGDFSSKTDIPKTPTTQKCDDGKLVAPKQKEKDFFAEVLVEMLNNHLTDAYNRNFTTSDWYKHMELLIKHDGVDFERASDVLLWHFEHLDRPYCHVILSARAFREKFLALEMQMKKMEARNDIAKVY